MSGGYSIRATPITEDGFSFDSILERDWAGFITHTGLEWHQESFAVLRDRGPVTPKNIVARPDFFLPDVSVIFECKPTPQFVWDNETRWRHESKRTGLPVVVTDCRPQPHWADVGDERVSLARLMGKRSPEQYASTLVLMPPRLWTFWKDREVLQTYFARCPDCTVVGLLAIPRDFTPPRDFTGVWYELAPELWLSPCRHRPTWTHTELVDAILQPFPTSGRVS